MYVGMNREARHAEIGEDRVPHVRGDEPLNESPAVIASERSPCTWG